MNYLARQSALLKAVKESYKGKPKEEQEAKYDEFDRITDLFKAMVYEDGKFVSDLIGNLMDNGKGIPVDRSEAISAYMTEINSICAKYNVKPVFPEAGSNASRDEIQGALKSFLDQQSALERHSRPAFQEAMKTKDFAEYFKLCDRLTETIEDVMEEEKRKEIWGEDDTCPEEMFLNPPDFEDDDAGEIKDGEEKTAPPDYIINLNEKCKANDGVMYRDSVIRQTISCLIGRTKPNALLVGAAGVGKTRIVEDIARRLENNDALIPDQLRGYSIWEFPLYSIVSGSGLVGDLEEKLDDVLDFARNPRNKVILFIDEIHMLVSGMQTYDKIGQIMKPALASGDIKVIGATTLQEVQNLMTDPAFDRRFTRLIVDELSKEQTKEVLWSMKETMFRHYDCRIVLNRQITDEAVEVAEEYKTINSHRPDNAITLLDRAMADALINRNPAEDTAEPLTKDQLKTTAMKLMTGNNEKTEVDMETLKDNLSVIQGQEEAINYLLDTIKRDSLSVFSRQKPLTFLFAGSSGVGKTEVTKIIAKTLTGLKPIILNMTEYTDYSTVNRIIGSPVGFIGSNSKAELPFDILESNPYQVILLDEFEKCDKAVQRLFMSAFDEGYIKTARGKAVDFSKSIIIATTNAGHTKDKKKIGFSFTEDDTNEASVAELSDYYDVELLNRFSKILNFRPISRECYKGILKDKYTREVRRIKTDFGKKYSGLDENLSDETAERLTKESYNEKFGARPANRTVQHYIEDELIS